MIWKKLFPAGEVFPAGERKTLEKLDQDTQTLRSWVERIEAEWPKDAMDRENRMREMAQKFATSPNEEAYKNLIILAGFPSYWKNTQGSGKEMILGTISTQIEEITAPVERPIVRKVLARALELTQREHEKQMAKEKKEAQEEGFSFSPSGKILALENRILGLKNEVARKYPDEGAIQHPGGWRVRLQEWL